MNPLQQFKAVWLVDTEFYQPDGERPRPLCLVAKEFHTGRLIRLCEDDLHRRVGPAFDLGENSLYIAYYAPAELGCHLAIGWPMPARILDLYAEFRCHTSGLSVPCRHGLLGALVYHGLDGMGSVEKASMRDLAMRGGNYSGAERTALLDYCQEDVEALARLLPAMLPQIDLPRALLRGRYMAAAAKIRWAGVPIDKPRLSMLTEHWSDIKGKLVERVDRDYGVYDGQTFKKDKFAEFLARHRIPWLRLDSGSLDLKDKTFQQMARTHPRVAPLRELRHAMGQLRLSELAVGQDGRNRCMLSVFRSKTGRNQPSNSRFIFGPAVWLRGLIKPQPGRALAYVDYSQQEFGIAAALSGDAAMMEAYRSGDPYLAFAKQAGAVPVDATKQSHPGERALFKACALGVQYGMGEQSLAFKIDRSIAEARRLLGLHHQTYAKFWQWSEAAVDHAMLNGSLSTVFGWRVHAGPLTTARSLMNFPMQANGAEILRLACCLTTEGGIEVCAPVHDALLVEAPTDDIDKVVAETQDLMKKAGEVVLGGFPLRSDVDIVKYPRRYADPRGRKMWTTVCDILDELCPGRIQRENMPT